MTYMQTLETLQQEGKITPFLFHVLEKSLPIMDDVMFHESVEEAITASSWGVKSKEDFHIFHYIEHYTDEIVEEIVGHPISNTEMLNLKQYMFSMKDKVDFSNLLTFRAVVLSWLARHKHKTAYLNIMSPPNRLPNKNKADWNSLAFQVQKLMRNGESEQEALLSSTAKLDMSERIDFMTWYRFRFGSGKNYDLQRKIYEDSEGLMKSRKVKNAIFQESDSKYFLPEYRQISTDAPAPSPMEAITEKENQEKFNTARTKLVARTFAIDKLLEKYRDVFSAQQIEELEEALYNLKRKIRILSKASIAEDAIIKTANICRKNNFHIGAHHLVDMAREVFGSQPKAISKTAAEIDYGEMQQVLNDLYNISNYLKRRDVVRQLAQIDLKLHNMMISSFFPEIGEAQSKLIDSMGYASNKLEDVMPKIRSSIQSPQQQAGPPPLGTPPQEAAQKTQEFNGQGGGQAQAPATPAPAKTPQEQPQGVQNLEQQLGNV